MTLLPAYYSRRAPEYEQIWYRNDPVRQAEQATIIAAMQKVFRDRRVLEVACGTAYWTQFVAGVARGVCAIDASTEMLALARAKPWPVGKVEFREGDAYALETVPGEFNGGLANFWFSHVPKSRVEEFLRGFHHKIGSGAAVFMADNVYVPGLGGDLISREGTEDTFKLRTLGDGSKHEVLKNYYEAGQLRTLLSHHATDLEICVGECFWWAHYVVRCNDASRRDS